jgi:hypothetical protein
VKIIQVGKKWIVDVVLVLNGVGIIPENVEIVAGLEYSFTIRNLVYMQNTQEVLLLGETVRYVITTNLNKTISRGSQKK